MWEDGDAGRGVTPVALHHQDVGLPGQLVEALAGRGVTRVADDLVPRTVLILTRALVPVEQVAETAQVGHVDDLDGPEAQRPGLLPGPVDLNEAQVQLGPAPSP